MSRVVLVMQVLHVDVTKFGTPKILGTSDFFANNGNGFQPGCTSNYCSHTRAVFYYYASIFSQYSFIAGKCDLCLSTVSSLACSGRSGLYSDHMSGVFCIFTTACFPYLYSFSTITTTTTTTTTATTCAVASLYPPLPVRPLPLVPVRPSPPLSRPLYRKCRRRRGSKCCFFQQKMQSSLPKTELSLLPFAIRKIIIVNS